MGGGGREGREVGQENNAGVKQPTKLTLGGVLFGGTGRYGVRVGKKKVVLEITA